MLLNATDDYENAGVTACIGQLDRDPDPALEAMTACDQNAYWKERFCRARYEKDGDARVRACVKDTGMIPKIVEFGVGG